MFGRTITFLFITTIYFVPLLMCAGDRQNQQQFESHQSLNQTNGRHSVATPRGQSPSRATNSTRRTNPTVPPKQSQFQRITNNSSQTTTPTRSPLKVSSRMMQTSADQNRDGDTRVPFWNIAHMINSIDKIEPTLSSGSNGIETDVSFDSRGLPVEVYHGFPCDCGRHCHDREDFTTFVRHIGKITSPPETSQLLLILFDLKLKSLRSDDQKMNAGRHLAKIIHENVYSRYQQAVASRPSDSLVQPPIRVVISINHAVDVPLVKSFIQYMRDNRLDFMSKFVGFDVGMNDNLNEIGSMWDTLNGATFNVWQGDGLTNCANLIRGIDRLKNAISIRNGQGHFRKVYYWTADIMYHIRSVLRLGLDAVLTNQPQRVVAVLGEPEFVGRYRPATPYDDPFMQFWIQASAGGLSFPTLGETVETISNIHKTSHEFVKTLPDGVSTVLKKVQHTIQSSIRA